MAVFSCTEGPRLPNLGLPGALPVMSTQPVTALPEPFPRPPDGNSAGCTILLPTTAIHVPASATTLAGFRAWAKSDEVPEHARVTFLDQQVLLDMSGEEIHTHAL